MTANLDALPGSAAATSTATRPGAAADRRGETGRRLAGGVGGLLLVVVLERVTGRGDVGRGDVGRGEAAPERMGDDQPREFELPRPQRAISAASSGSQPKDAGRDDGRQAFSCVSHASSGSADRPMS
ncbi:hypothetical protein QA811_27175 [Streptomyces sp. B21-102]|uniref:hypothetical protein n=1 Tax=Streptomyces sp. B21-102 TaxID=3039416 RepID=UPI002FF2CF3C